MTETQDLWLIDGPPATEDPEIMRVYIRDMRSIEPQTPVVATMIATAEDILRDLERAQRAA